MAGRKTEDDPWDAEEERVRVALVNALGERASKVSDTMMVTFVRGYHYEIPVRGCSYPHTSNRGYSNRTCRLSLAAGGENARGFGTLFELARGTRD